MKLTIVSGPRGLLPKFFLSKRYKNFQASWIYFHMTLEWGIFRKEEKG